MPKLTVQSSRILAPIKPMHAVGQPPIGGGPRASLFRHMYRLTDIGAPFSRLHDVGGNYGGNRFVDVPNIFRDFDADECDPASYDFTFTDALLLAMKEAGVEPYYRLGVTIETSTEIKAYRTFPPKDFAKWARVCEHIIAHYNEGWADGYHLGITYWEIWNEPDGDSCDELHENWNWCGTAEQFYDLYEITAAHLKSRFPSIKIGGYGAIGFQAITDKIFGPDPTFNYPERTKYWLTFFDGFLRRVKEKHLPLDFFSFHCYRSVDRALIEAAYCKEQLDAYGFGEVEIHLNEWNPDYTTRCTPQHSAHIAAMMLGMQNSPVDMLMLYDARLQGSGYAALFHPLTLKPTYAYYALAAFSELYRLGHQCELTVEEEVEGLYAIAATNAEGTRGALMLANVSGHTQPISIEGVDLTNARWYVLDDGRLLSWTAPLCHIPHHAVVLVTY